MSTPPDHPSCSGRRRLLLGAASVLCPAVDGRAAPVRAPEPPPMPLARDWSPGDDPAGWLASEKFDGVRALWDGRRLRFRSGREVPAPPAFLARLPQEPLDGELWLGRGRFEALSGLVRRATPAAADWADLRYLVFELPGAPGPFAQRADRLRRIVARTDWAPLQAVAQQPVADAAALRGRLDEVLRDGGEGLMLHRADAPWAPGRNGLLRKLKPLADAEAVVLGHQPGRGALAGLAGALRVRADDGREFDIGTGLSAAQRRAPPPPGTRITYTHRGFTGHGLPRFASLLRVAPTF
ncbi:DNA ligase [Ideonella sp. A 288]|uniref:DNA ligase n=1 Tax=Ideonella sp. A 288 TaxID=1962181 RepID=UPI000B4BCBC9|nr:DNA ligase [Ideonella sp. A 288]